MHALSLRSCRYVLLSSPSTECPWGSWTPAVYAVPSMTSELLAHACLSISRLLDFVRCSRAP
eukprot:4595022-Amphidinium_carterae.4